jgi:hypothetical protein
MIPDKSVAARVPRGRLPTWAGAAGVCLLVSMLGLVLSSAAMIRRPDRYITFEYVLGDHSLNLLVADELQSGHLLYRDIFYHYGPVPAYAYAGFARLLGNTPTSFLTFHQLVGFVTLGLLTWLLQRSVRTLTACFVVIMGVLPVFLTPGALLGSYTSSAYIPLERLCLVLLALAWVPPASRGLGRAALLGLILGLWQGVKFGGAFYAGLGVLLTDALALALVRPSPLGHWVKMLAVTGASFLAVEAGWAVLAFSFLPRPVAVDALWPQYMLVQYASLAASPLPVWDGWRYFLGQQLTPLVGVLLGLAAVAGALRAAFRKQGAGGPGLASPDSMRLFVPFAFFLLGFFGYFRHVHLPLQYVWAGCLAGALVVDRLPRPAWLILGLCWLPGFGLMLKTDLVSGHSPDVRACRMPAGDVLYLTEEEDQLVSGITEELARLRSEEADRDCVLFYPSGAGMHHYYGIPRAGRHVWYLAGFVRPYESAEVSSALGHEYALVFVSDRPITEPRSDPGEMFNAMFARPVFDGEICDALRSRLHDPVPVGSRCLVYRVR